MPLSNQPIKGTRDWFPEEFTIRNYIFNVWRKVCLRYGYEEYLTPLMESAEIYRAKSGEDIAGPELMVFTDQGGRELAIRPEMTPSVTRMVSQVYNAIAKPVRYFSIANFMRNEKPQRGRNREFWQLNVDIFGSNSINADLEILQLALDIMLEFNPPKNAFFLGLNSRKLINSLLDEVLKINPKKYPQTRLDIIRTLDKWEKLSRADCKKRLKDLGLGDLEFDVLDNYMSSKDLPELLSKMPILQNNQGVQDLEKIIKRLQALGYGDWIQFKPNIVRGLDYYDGLIFEVFDNNLQNTRSLFGGGRYNGLAELFGNKSFPAVGFAPGDETTRIFLESWGLLEEIKKQQQTKLFYVPLLNSELIDDTQLLAKKLRAENKNVILGTEEQRLNKALDYANKKKINYLVIFDEAEQKKQIYKIKDMESGVETEIKLNLN